MSDVSRQVDIDPEIVFAAQSALQQHPFQYGFIGRVMILHTEDVLDPRVGERFNRCPVCEQWAPCDVRKIALWILEHGRE